MDEAAFREALTDALASPCAFGRAILGCCAACDHSSQVQIAEREAIACQNAASHSRCRQLHALLRDSFSFALGKARISGPLTHAEEMRVQCGGLKGLRQVLEGRTEIANIDTLVGNALQRWGRLDRIPYSEVVHAAAAAYKGRRR